MAEINIEINIAEKKWLKILPDVEEVVKKAIIVALTEAGIAQFTQYLEVSVLLTNDNFIQTLNRDYLEKDKATNVLSFPLEDFVAGKYQDLESNIILGDIIFALETIQKEAQEQNKEFTNHLAHLAIHGTLHLLGFDHEIDNEAETMEALEVDILRKLNIQNPY